MALTIDERIEKGWLVVAVGGDLDLYTVASLRSLLSDALATVKSGGACRDTLGQAPGVAGVAETCSAAVHGVVVDLTAVTFMDSAGLGVLVGAHKRAAADGTPLQLAGASAAVSMLFEITGLSKVFQVQPSLGVALTG